ncbi:MAG: 1,4-dihydroxy-2-naphthoate octaprenyltransferase [Deltaproteobacteria bacterium]|nr:1,4-dihydroxy-2-naphthoate octaprenyltransferase [Deltaproteobacteria bacterium]
MNTYIRALRLPFLTGSLVPVLQAGALAYLEGTEHLLHLILVLIGVGALHSAGNLINDYIDTPRSDTINPNPTPFSGGSRVILDNLLTARWVFWAAVICFTLAALIGLYLIWNGRPYVALIGLLGLIAGLFYSAGPVPFMSRGLGEITIFFAFGPLITWGTYYVLTGRLTGPAFLLGFPLGFLITAIIWVNEFPDYQADKEAGKRNLVVRLGLASSRWVYLLLMLSPFPFLVLLVALQGMPAWILLGWLTLPLALKGIGLTWKEYNRPGKIVPAQALTIQTHMILGLLMVTGLLIQLFIG